MGAMRMANNNVFAAPVRTEAEHPQPRFGQEGLFGFSVKKALPKAGLFQLDSSGVLRPDHSLALAAA